MGSDALEERKAEALRFYRAFRLAAKDLPQVMQKALMREARAIERAGGPVRESIAARKQNHAIAATRRADILAVVADRPGLTVREVCIAIFGTADVDMFECVHKTWDECFALNRNGKLDRDANGRYWPKG